MRRAILFLLMTILALPVVAQVYPPVHRSMNLGSDNTPTTCSDGELLVASSGEMVCSDISGTPGINTGPISASSYSGSESSAIASIMLQLASETKSNLDGLTSYCGASAGTTSVCSAIRVSDIGTYTGVAKWVGLNLEDTRENALSQGATNAIGIFAGPGAIPASDYFIYSTSSVPSRFGGDLILAGSTVPSTASDTCTTGTVSWGADYVYVCVATDTWKRAAIATW